MRDELERLRAMYRFDPSNDDVLFAIARLSGRIAEVDRSSALS
jgi:hypothetical protein